LHTVLILHFNVSYIGFDDETFIKFDIEKNGSVLILLRVGGANAHFACKHLFFYL